MRRQLERIEHDPRALLDRELRRDRGVDAPTLGRTDVVVERRPHDRVAELVAAGGLEQQPCLHEPVEGAGDVVLALGEQAGDEPEMAEREPGEHRHHLRQLHIDRRPGEQPPQQRRAGSQPGCRRADHEAGPPVAHHDRTALGERLRHLLREERVAVRRHVHRLGERVVGCGAENTGDQRSRLVAIERFEIEQGGAPFGGHGLDQPLDIGLEARPQREDDEHRHIDQPCEQRRHRQRLAVGDVEVLEHDDRGAVRREGAAHHQAGRKHSLKLIVSMLVDGGAQLRAVVGWEPSEEIAEGGVRDPTVEVVGAAGDDTVPELASAAGKLGDEARLADAGLAAHEERDRRATLHPLQQLETDGQVELPPDQQRNHCRQRTSGQM